MSNSESALADPGRQGAEQKQETPGEEVPLQVNILSHSMPVPSLRSPVYLFPAEAESWRESSLQSRRIQYKKPIGLWKLQAQQIEDAALKKSWQMKEKGKKL